MVKAKRLLIGYLFLLLLIPFDFQEATAQSSLARYQALYTMRFLKYVNWKTDRSQYVIGVIGASSQVLPQLSKLTSGRLVNGKKVVVKKISSYHNLGQYSVIFIPKNQSSKFYRIQNLLKKKDVLVVTEDPTLAKKGAGISFYVVQSKLKFRLNKKEIYSRNMTVNPRLLSVATVL